VRRRTLAHKYPSETIQTLGIQTLVRAAGAKQFVARELAAPLAEAGHTQLKLRTTAYYSLLRARKP